ncbi:hypothetical protein [Rhizobium sp. Root1203]|nr:hypothetical protein [Rhizobium sp. Root1203]
MDAPVAHGGMLLKDHRVVGYVRVERLKSRGNWLTLHARLVTRDDADG